MDKTKKLTVADRFKRATIRAAIGGLFDVVPVRELMAQALGQFGDLMKKAADHLNQKELAEDETAHAMLVDFKTLPDGSVKAFAHLVAIVDQDQDSDILKVRRKEVTAIETKVREFAKFDVPDKVLVDLLVDAITNQGTPKLDQAQEPPQLRIETND